MLIKKINRHIYIVIIAVAFSAHSIQLYPQDKAGNDYLRIYNSGNYKNSLEIINRRLDEIYIKRVDDKRVPTGFITMKALSKEKDLYKLFRNRKAGSFFIEDNREISTLHLYAARCNFRLSNYDYSLNHYIQSLRFKKTENKKDDVIYYEISQVFKKTDHFNAYVNTLESAVTLNPGNYKYSLELGRALYKTSRKKRAIYHLERYINSTEDRFLPELYLMIGNLYEDIAKYLETEKYYIKYLNKKPDDGYIQFALGYIAYKRTGNHSLAIASLNRSLKLLPEKELYRRCKSYEYIADIALKELDFNGAVGSYTETIKYHEKIEEEIKSKKGEINEISKKINSLKSSLLKEQDFDQYTEYESLLDIKGKKETELMGIENEYNKLNVGKVRWNIADSLERMEKLGEAIKYYRDAIMHDYNSNQARKKIIKLKLKIKRGY